MEDQETKVDDICSYAGGTAADLLRVLSGIVVIASIIAGLWYILTLEDWVIGIIIIFSGSLTSTILFVLSAICDNLLFIRHYLAKLAE